MEAQPGGGGGGGGGGGPGTPGTGGGGGGAGGHEEEAAEDKAGTDCTEGKTTGTAPNYENKRQKGTNSRYMRHLNSVPFSKTTLKYTLLFKNLVSEILFFFPVFERSHLGSPRLYLFNQKIQNSKID